MSENNKIGFVVGTLVVAAIGGGYLLARSWTGKELTPLEAARVIPENTLLAGYLTTSSQTWSKLEQFGTPEAQKLIGEPIKKQLEQASKENSTTDNINYSEDIEPWLGNVMVAVLPPEQETAKLLLVVGIKDKFAAVKFFDKLKKQEKNNLTESEYKGITIIENKDEEREQLSILAIFDNKVVISADRKTLEEAIDTYKNGSSFADKPGAKEILTKNNRADNTLFQLYVPDYKGLLQQYAKFARENLNNSQIDRESLETFERQIERFNYVDAMVFSLGIKDDRGITMQSITKYNSSKIKSLLKTYPKIPGKVLSQIPGNSLLLISSGGISQSWSWFVEEFGDIPEFKEGLDEVRESLKSTTNLDLDKDIIGWMDREFAISVIPSNNSPVMVSGVMIVSTSDRATAQKTIDTLENLAKSSGNLPISNSEVAGKEVTEYSNYPGGQVIMAYTWLDNNSFAVTVGDKADKIVELKTQDSLIESKDFQEITRDFSKTNLGYFYLNFKEVNTLIDRFAKTTAQPIPPETKAFLDSVKGIAGVTTITDSTTVEQNLLIELATSNKN